jgi:hypothetical protein
VATGRKPGSAGRLSVEPPTRSKRSECHSSRVSCPSVQGDRSSRSVGRTIEFDRALVEGEERLVRLGKADARRRTCIRVTGMPCDLDGGFGVHRLEFELA